MPASEFFSEEDKTAISRVIAEAEKKTSGEIRVHVVDVCKDDPVKTAAAIFQKLKMQETKERNGVLFFLAVESRVFAIYGDQGIHEKVPAGFWNEISALMEKEFREGRFTQGLVSGIQLAGEQLARYFPCATDDKNELSDEVSFQ